jgi:hypothetical protein
MYRNSYLKLDPPDPVATGRRMSWGESRLGDTLSRTRASVGRTTCPGALCATGARFRGMPDRILIPCPGHSCMRTTARSAIKEPKPALRQPGSSRSASESGTRLRSGPLKRVAKQIGGSGPRSSATATYNGQEWKPQRDPAPRTERGGDGGALCEAGEHIRARSGRQTGLPIVTHRDGPARLGSA